MHYWDQTIITNIRKGFYSAVYFNRTQEILLKEHNLTPVTMQIFQKKDNTTIAGVDMVLELCKQATGYFEKDQWIDKYDQLHIKTISDGEVVNGWETVMHITGPYAYFAHLESLYLGILARASHIATNTKHVMNAAGEKPVTFFADRFDYFLNQSLDGYAAHIGGITGVCTDAHTVYWKGKPVGTIPHALIAIHNGDTIKAAESFARQYPDVPLIVLVDFDNDCVTTALAVAKQFGKKLWGVRLDTSEKMIDKSLQTGVISSNVIPAKAGISHGEGDPRLHEDDNNKKNISGVNPQLVHNVRQALNKEGYNDVKIVVSGGFTADKIKLFESEQVPVDMYGVGSSLLQGNIDFTADIVKVGDRKVAKMGRTFKENPKLETK
jgi:nicotinate phosphoribosyltransferase